ncbi:MAG: membrane protein insertion efficiency factor YidD [Candidatus Eremiobacteraeota bacterium]|nr:membrane protein insertion efficiency factor YidD [Candidatus Eremiobacteraeota bacterium]
MLRSLFVALIRLYQLLVSPLLPPACRFYPTCSQYALVAIRNHGPGYGGWLALARLARCNPWHPGGVDEVPANASQALHDVQPVFEGTHPCI